MSNTHQYVYAEPAYGDTASPGRGSGRDDGRGRPPAVVHPPERPQATVTWVLIALNVLVFVAMVSRGVSFMQPGPREVLPWGADFGPLTVGAGQWWRMLTACFVHFGIVHIGMNMFVLWQVGPFTEMVFGRMRYVLLYVAAGLTGSLASLALHPLTTSAGASGAIFGLYGAVFAFLLAERAALDGAGVKSLARSAGVFVVFNMVYGSMSRGTDIAAHLGGLAGGFVFGFLLVRPREGGPRRLPVAVPVVLLVVVVALGMRGLAQRIPPGIGGLLTQVLLGERLPLPQNGALVYGKDVLPDEAKRASTVLHKSALSSIPNVVAVFSRENGRLRMSVPLSGQVPRSGEDGAGNGPAANVWDDPEMVSEFAEIGDALGAGLCKPVDVVLMDPRGVARRTIAGKAPDASACDRGPQKPVTPAPDGDEP